MHVRSTPNNYTTDLEVFLLNLKTKRFKDMESLAAAEGLYWGKQGIEVEKVGWDLLGMSEELEKYYQQLSHLSVAASLWSGILYIL